MKLYQKKTICIAFPSEDFYEKCMEERKIFRQYLEENYEKHSELFPKDIRQGYSLHGFSKQSKKQKIRIRRILLKKGGAYLIRPSFMMPYMVGRTEEVEKALFLRRWGVPFDALSYVFGGNAMYWYRCYLSVGRNAIVGTTVKSEDELTEHLVADEKHTWWNGEKVYVATTVGKGCILGVSLIKSANSCELEKGYQVFKAESQNLKEDYSPITVNTDGWEATQDAWKTLFPTITLILCFLHAFLRIKAHCSRQKELFKIISEKVWHAYQGDSLAAFSQRIRRLREWAYETLNPGTLKGKVLTLCKKAFQFKVSYKNKGCYRTSNQLDRLMNYQDRLLYSMQYFHGNWDSAELYVRAMGLLLNFHPYGIKTQLYTGRASPFKDINSFQYHQNWLHNLLIAASLGGRKC